MTTTIELAKQANRYASNQTNDSHDWQIIRDERFAALVRNATLEESAKVCEEQNQSYYPDGTKRGLHWQCASAIRQLKGKQ